MLADALNVAPLGGTTPFRDVAAGTPDAGAINAAAALGWVAGLPGGRFQPDAPLTVGAMAKIVDHAIGLPTPATAAGPGPAWARPFLVALLRAGILEGEEPAGATVSPATADAVVAAAVHDLAEEPGNIMGLTTEATVASTVDATNGDRSPYGVTYDGFAGTPQEPNPFFGDLLVTNFADRQGLGGFGSTVEAVNPESGAVRTFTATAAGPVALAVSPKGPVWIANFGATGADGDVEVTTPTGGTFPNGGSFIHNPALAGPWGQVFVPGTTPAFLVTNVLTGTLYAMYGFSPPNFDTDTKFLPLGTGLPTRASAFGPLGPQGMVYDPATGKVYVTDGADDSIRAFTWSGPNTAPEGQGVVVYRGAPLSAPAGITLDPANGDLLVVNQGDNRLVELRLTGTSATVVGERVLDHTPVNPRTGSGSALFGVYAMLNAQHALQVYYTDDNTNTLDVLH